MIFGHSSNEVCKCRARRRGTVTNGGPRQHVQSALGLKGSNPPADLACPPQASKLSPLAAKPVLKRLVMIRGTASHWTEPSAGSVAFVTLR